jgi:hypothetical protein
MGARRRYRCVLSRRTRGNPPTTRCAQTSATAFCAIEGRVPFAKDSSRQLGRAVMLAERIRSAISGLLWPPDGILGEAPPPYWHGSSGDTTHPRIALRWCFLPKLGTRRKTAGSLSLFRAVGPQREISSAIAGSDGLMERRFVVLTVVGL